MFISKYKISFCFYCSACVVFILIYFHGIQPNKINLSQRSSPEPVAKPKTYLNNVKKHDENSESLVKRLTNSINHDTEHDTDNSGTNVAIFDLNQAELTNYEDIKCRKSAEIYVSTTLCVHDLNKDSFVS